MQAGGAEAGAEAGAGAGAGTGAGTGPGTGAEGGDCADLQDLELKESREGTLQHGPGAILEGAIGSGRQSGWQREISGPEGCPRTCFITTTKRSNAKKIEQSGARTC